VWIAWRGTRAARRCQLPDRLAGDTYRQAPSASNSPSLQPPPGGTVYTARQTLFQEPLFVSPPPGGAYPTARRHPVQNPTKSLPSPGATHSRRQALYQYSSTPLEFPVTSFHGSLLLASNAILTNWLITSPLDLTIHNALASMEVPYLKPFS